MDREQARRAIRRVMKVAGVKQLVEDAIMYRGARHGSPSSLSGPSYFISSELFAKTYGATAAFKLKLRKPLVVSNSEWFEYASNGMMPVEEIAERVTAQGHDSVVNVRSTPGGQMLTVFLVNPSQAKLIR